MNLNRQIKLSPQMRKQIALEIQKGWVEDNPRPDMTVSRANLARLENWKKTRSEVLEAAVSVLGTFVSVNQLQEIWPEAVKFVPFYLIDPAKGFKLPKRVAA